MRGDQVYLHVFDWPSGGALTLPAQVASARLLADGSTLAVRQTADGSVLVGPAQPADPIDTVIVCSVGHS